MIKAASRRLLAALASALLLAGCITTEIGGWTPATTAAPEEHPDRQLARAHRQLALGLEAAGDVEGALDELEQALAADRRAEIAERKSAEVQRKAALGEAAASGLEGTPYDELARICLQGDPSEQVIRACTLVVASFTYSSGRLAEFITRRGDAYAALDDPERAEIDYAAALKVDSSYPDALLGRARARAKLGNHKGAADDYRRAIGAGLDAPPIRMERAEALVAAGDPAAAIPEYDHVLSDPESLAAHPGAYRGRAEAYCLAGEADAAAIDWQVWLATTPDGPSVVQEMLQARNYLRGPVGDGFGPEALAGLRAWTRDGCPEG